MNRRRQVGVVLRGDLRYHLRDPIALLLMVLLPVVVLPVLLAGFSNYQTRQQAALEEVALHVSASAGLAERLADAPGIVLVQDGSFAAGSLDLEVVGSLDPQTADVVLRYQGSEARSLQALERVRSHLESAHQKVQADQARELGNPYGPGEALEVQWVDLASDQERSGKLLGRLVPLVLVFLVVSGGLYTALDLFAGEKERGTLETLLTTRIDRGAVLLAKSLAVLSFSLLTGWLALASLWATVGLGLVRTPVDSLQVSGTSVVLLGLMLIPLAAELTSLLAVAAAWAPDVRTGQALAIPLLLVSLVPASLGAFPGVELTPATALVPIGNLTLAARDVLAGRATAGPLLMVVSATGLHAWLAGAVAARMLGREGVIVGGGSRSRRAHERFGPEVFAAGSAVLLGVWFLGQAAASLGPLSGHLATQVLLLALPAVGLVWWLGQPLRRTLSLTTPRPTDLGLAVIAGVAAPALSLLVEALQAPLLPLPPELLEAASEATFLQELSLPVLILGFAVVPALAEELFFRGAFLGLLRNSLAPRARCVVVGLAFGLLHLSIYRVLPTGALGILLAFAALRSGSIWPGALMHALHNGLLLTWATQASPSEPPGLPLLLVGAGVAIAAVAGLGRR